MWLPMDVTRPEQIAATINRVMGDWGNFDILVNNAGVNTMAHRVPIDEFPREEWDRLLAVDLTGLYEVSRAATRVMRAQGSGRVINIASTAGLVPLRLQCAFVAAKAGVIHLTKADGLGTWPARHSGQRDRSRLDADRRHASVVLRPRRRVPRIDAADARARSEQYVTERSTMKHVLLANALRHRAASICGTLRRGRRTTSASRRSASSRGAIALTRMPCGLGSPGVIAGKEMDDAHFAATNAHCRRATKPAVEAMLMTRPVSGLHDAGCCPSPYKPTACRSSPGGWPSPRGKRRWDAMGHRVHFAQRPGNIEALHPLHHVIDGRGDLFRQDIHRQP